MNLTRVYFQMIRISIFLAYRDDSKCKQRLKDASNSISENIQNQVFLPFLLTSFTKANRALSLDGWCISQQK